MALQHADDAVGEPGAEDRGRQREGHRFDQHEPEQPGAAGADGGAGRVLLLALQAAREQQPADVGAGDQEEQADGAEERHEQALAFGVQHRPAPGGRGA